MISIKEYNKREEERLNKEAELRKEEKGLRLELKNLEQKLVELRDPLYYLDEIVLKKYDTYRYRQILTDYSDSVEYRCKKKTKLENIDKVIVETIEKEYNTEMIQIRTHEKYDSSIISYIVFLKLTSDYSPSEKQEKTFQKIKDNICKIGMDKKYDVQKFSIWHNGEGFGHPLEITSIPELLKYENKKIFKNTTTFIEDINRYVASENIKSWCPIAKLEIEDLEKKERLECKARNDRIKVLEEEMTKLKQLQKYKNEG
ncbi:MAG: hypothetical protein ACP5N1_04160 [Candidatus Woesearchaeota archaeon]